MRLQMVHDRFAHTSDLGVRVGSRGMFEVSSSLYLDTHAGNWKPQWLLVQTLHDPSRKNLGHNVAFISMILPAFGDGSIAGPALLECPDATREEILATYAEKSVPNEGADVWSQRSEEVKS